MWCAPIRYNYQSIPKQMNGESVSRLVEEFFQPLRAALDYVFAAGVAYGASHLAAFSWRCWRGFRVYCLPLGNCTRVSLKDRFGEWAVVVGATSDIGQAYAEELARRGMSVVLISKSYDSLVQLVARIQLEYSVQAYGIHADFSLGRHVYQEIDDALQGFEIGILVNSVAITYNHPQFFVLIPPQRLMQILDVNITATTVMTYMLLPQMLERQKGAIINVCSEVATLPPSPLLAAYSASMAYLKSFSQSLHHESLSRGIIIQTLLPCFLAGPGSPPSLFSPSPSTYVSHAMATLGVATTTCGYWPHSIQSWVCSCVPQWLWVWLVSLLYRRHRLSSIAQAKQQGTEQFTRRRRSSVVAISLANPNQRPTTRPTGQPAIRRVSDDLGLPLRRSPSPKRKILSSLGPAAATPLRPLSPVKRPPLDPLHPFSREDVTLLPSRIPTHGNIPSPIPESPLSPYPSPQFFPPGSKPAKNSSALPPSFNTSTPLAAHPQAGGGGTLLPPKRSYSASSATGPDSFHQRRLPIRHSRVLVVPSVARYSQQSLEPPVLTFLPTVAPAAVHGGSAADGRPVDPHLTTEHTTAAAATSSVPS